MYTDFSIQEYQLQIPIMSTIPAGAISDLGATDGNLVVDGLYSTNYYSSNTKCFVGLDFGKDF